VTPPRQPDPQDAGRDLGADGDPEEVVTEAGRRLQSGPFTSGLSINDFAACLQMGMRPVGFVQGFCAMQWSFYYAGSPYLRGSSPYSGGSGTQYYETWNCPHGFVSAEHRSWGQNYEQTWVESTWGQGFGAAYSRMMEEAAEVGAHGVIGVVDTMRHLGDVGITEFHITGTAVVVDGQAPPPRPWTTFLAGQRLNKLMEAGWAPVSVAASFSSIRVWAYCVTEYLMRGSGYGGFGGGLGGGGLGGGGLGGGGVLGGVLGAATGGTMGGRGGGGAGYGTDPGEIGQVSSAHMAARRRARNHIKTQIGGDDLHGVQLSVTEREIGEGDMEISCLVKGTRVHRVRPYEQLPAPRPTVSLA
jgi:hypothetical protein